MIYHGTGEKTSFLMAEMRAGVALRYQEVAPWVSRWRVSKPKKRNNHLGTYKLEESDAAPVQLIETCATFYNITSRENPQGGEKQKINRSIDTQEGYVVGEDPRILLISGRSFRCINLIHDVESPCYPNYGQSNL